MNKKILLGMIFFVYVALRVATNIPAIQKPRELADTTAYLRISREPLQSQKFWGDARPFVFPLLLKISSQDVSAAATLHLGLSILVWGFLALTVSANFHWAYLDLVSYSIILALSLVPHLAGWDYVMMTESLSVTFFVLFVASGIWLAQKWCPYRATLLIVSAFLLAFTRDTNAYLLLMLTGLLTVAVILRWIQPCRFFLLSSFFLIIFLLNNYTSDIGSRWVFPLNNVIGKRILTDSSAIEYFKTCEMPVTPELLALADSFANGNDRAFYEDPALENYRTWLYADGKSCYVKYLLAHPFARLAEALNQFETLIRFDSVTRYFARQYDPVIPYFIEPFIYPVYFIIPLWILLTAISLYAIWKKLWVTNPLWGIYALLVLPILPHLFITWHGDSMAPERHALSVGLQLALSFWLMIFLLAENLLTRLSVKTS